MITLTGYRKMDHCIVFNDDDNPYQFYYLPDTPRVALDDTGKPSFSLLWYRRDLNRLTDEERRTRLGGGILYLTVELTLSDEEVQKTKVALAKERFSAASDDEQKRIADQIRLGPVLIKEGEVTLGLLGETGATAGDFVSTLVGAGKVSMAGGMRAAFMAKLTMEGGVLLWKALEKEFPGILVNYDLKFDHRLNGVELRVWCDAKKSYSAFHDQWNHITDDAGFSEVHSGHNTTVWASRNQTFNAGDRLAITAIDSECARVDVIASSSEVKPDTIDKLTQTGMEVLKDFLAQSFLTQIKPEPPPDPGKEPKLETQLPEYGGRKYGHHGIDYYSMKSTSEFAAADLDYRTRSKYVLENTEHISRDLKGMMRGQKLQDCRVQIDLDDPFYKYLSVQVQCTTDFTEDPVDLVKVHIVYQGQGALGNINTIKDFVFKKDTPPQLFLSYLYDVDQLGYHYDVEVFYKGSAKSYTYGGDTDEAILVLDTDRLGIIRVDVQAGIINWDIIQQVEVKMGYGSGADHKEIEFMLDPKNPTYRWIEAIGQPIKDRYAYKATFIDKSGQRIELDPQYHQGPRLLINQPLDSDLEVAVVPAGGFGADGLFKQIVVALRYQDGDYLVDNLLTFTKDGEAKLWTVPLRNKKQRRYQYQQTVFYNDGVVREDPWLQSDKQIVPVGDPFGMKVQISPYLLKIPPGAWAFGTINLKFDDAQAGIHAERTMEISDFSKPLVWRFRLGSQDKHTYRYQLTLYKADGTAVQTGELEESKEILVLVPPAQNVVPAPVLPPR